MMISIWRYSHLTLAISSFLLLTVLSVTGIFLAFEPVIDQPKDVKSAGFDTLTLAHTVPLLKEKFPGIQEIRVDDYDHVIIQYTEQEEGNKEVYADPSTGAVLGVPAKKSSFFVWMTALHRSLFLHETGRVLVGITAFLLILIAVSGMLLIAQRQNGWRHFFSKVEKTSTAQYYHIAGGRISLLFILVIAVTGTYLALYRFMPAQPKASAKVVEENTREEPVLSLAEFPVFQAVFLSQLKKLQYPFSEFPEDYYTLQLKDRELCVNQFTGDILAEQKYSHTYQLASLSLQWHTGRSGTIWSVMLAISSGYILFFIYSGFAITFRRLRHRTKNIYRPDEARIVILVGSENGNTFRFAHAVYRQLIQHKEKVFITPINSFRFFPKVEHLVVMTSTYGQGEPPTNAKKIAGLLEAFPKHHPVQYSVLGFGSRSYSHFCKFAFDIDRMLSECSWATARLPVFTIHDQSPQDFSAWLTAWTHACSISVMMPRELLEQPPKDLSGFTVAHRTATDTEASFMIRFRSPVLKQARSGDLLAVYPANDHRERLYSIGVVNRHIQLSVKVHTEGLGSSYLHGLREGDQIKARLIKNKQFRFPQKVAPVIMVCNGTGIAPFLGMIAENRKKYPIVLYCGFRNKAAFELYEPFLKEQLQSGKLQCLYVSFSREADKEYVGDRIRLNQLQVRALLQQSAVIMICGSIKMQNDVLCVFESICKQHGLPEMAACAEEGRLLTDCY